MPPFPFDLDPEDNFFDADFRETDVFDEGFADLGQRSGLSQMQVEALRRAATEQVRRTAGSVTSSADFQDFFKSEWRCSRCVKKCCKRFI
jgi:hypothetical protein